MQYFPAVVGRVHKRLSCGFSLIELMISVAIVAILAAVALPSYKNYVIRGKLTGAQSTLAGLATSLQQYYQDNRSYVGACAAGTVAPLPAATTDFTYTCPAGNLTATTFVAQATGNAGSVVNGFAFVIDQNGIRQTTAAPAGWVTSIYNAATNPSSCWVSNPSGNCS